MLDPLNRDLNAASDGPFDLIIIGGGIQGACLALAAAQNGLRSLLVEQDDFGGKTSANTLRILHGGFRYLQGFQISRVLQSARDSMWFATNFPDLVTPLGCLLPLYGHGVRRPGTVQPAISFYHFLLRLAVHNPTARRGLLGGRVLSAEETRLAFPGAGTKGLRGGALWYDYFMHSPARIIIEILRRAASLGAIVLNYVQATGIVTHGQRVDGINAMDRITGKQHCFRSRAIVNCAGPGCLEILRQSNIPAPRFPAPSLAFNLLLDCRPLSRYILAVAPEGNAKPTFVLVPMGNYVLVGTYHTEWRGEEMPLHPRSRHVSDFLALLNRAAPQLEASLSKVVRVYSGLIPSLRNGSTVPLKKPTVIDHRQYHGPSGLYSVWEVKFTTSPSVAVHVLRKALGKQIASFKTKISIRPPGNSFLLDQQAFLNLVRQNPKAAEAIISNVTRDESCFCLEDILYRRTEWAVDPGAEKEIVPLVDRVLRRSPEECERSYHRTENEKPHVITNKTGSTLSGATTL